MHLDSLSLYLTDFLLPSLQEPPTPMRGLNVPGQFENASNRRAGRFGPQAGGPGAGASVGGGENSKVESGMNFAERMMAKMGHKEGQGENQKVFWGGFPPPPAQYSYSDTVV